MSVESLDAARAGGLRPGDDGDGTAISDSTPPAVRFVVLGVGGLGCPAVLGLLAAGATDLLLVDDDVVDASNLHRQVLFNIADVGAPKVEAAGRHVLARNRQARVETRRERVSESTRAEFFASLRETDIVLDCTDSPSSKFQTNDQSVTRGLRSVIGGVIGWSGQVMAVDGSERPRVGACYRCVFESPPPRALAPACADVGVLGAASGAIGWWMSLLAVRLASAADPAERALQSSEDPDAATEARSPIAGRLMSLDVRSMNPRWLAPPMREGCTACSAPARRAV
jgi:adenylyltransferase/sulfurtransferase